MFLIYFLLQDDKTVPSSQTPANVAAEFFFEAEARVKTAEAEVENIEQKILEVSLII